MVYNRWLSVSGLFLTVRGQFDERSTTYLTNTLHLNDRALVAGADPTYKTTSLFLTIMEKHYKQLTQWIGLLLTVVCLLLSQTTFAQSIPDAQWARVGSTLSITTDGNIVTSTNAASGQGATVTKYDLQGNIIWSKGSLAGASYLGGKLPIPGTCPCVGGYAIITDISAITPTPDGGVALLAREYGGRGIITSLNAAGQQGGRDYMDMTSIVTPDGGSLSVSSFTEDLGLGRSRIGVLVEKTGNPSWTTRLSDGSNDESVTNANLAFNTPDGGYLLAG